MSYFVITFAVFGLLRQHAAQGVSCFVCNNALTNGQCNTHSETCNMLCQTTVRDENGQHKITKYCSNGNSCWNEAENNKADCHPYQERSWCIYCCSTDYCNREEHPASVTTDETITTTETTTSQRGTTTQEQKTTAEPETTPQPKPTTETDESTELKTMSSQPLRHHQYFVFHTVAIAQPETTSQPNTTTQPNITIQPNTTIQPKPTTQPKTAIEQTTEPQTMEAETTPESNTTPTSKKTSKPSDFTTSQQEPTTQSNNVQLETTTRDPQEPVQERTITKRSSGELLNYMQPGTKQPRVASTIASLGVCLGIGPSNGRRKFVKCN